MKQCKFVLLTLVIVTFTGAALTHAGSTHARLTAARGASQLTRQSHSPFADTALQRWRLGGATHWRSMLLQR